MGYSWPELVTMGSPPKWAASRCATTRLRWFIVGKCGYPVAGSGEPGKSR